MSAAYFPPALHMASLVLLVVVVIAAAFVDIRERRIPNVITFPAMAVGFVVSTWVAEDHARGALMSLLGWALGIGLFLIPVAFMGRGAGDLKLLAAVGAIGGPVFVIWAAVLTTAFGGILAVAVLLAKRQFGTVAGGIALDVMMRQKVQAASDIRLPYAVPIAAGALVTAAIGLLVK
ncbi:MAG: prepilin peptidase [Chloroflexota bacterium]